MARPSAATIRAERLRNPEMRERDFAAMLGVSEAEFVAAFCGDTARRIEPRLTELLPRLSALGEVMALTRNQSAVHEKIGVYQEPSVGAHAALFLGEDIDLRIFPRHWVHAFAVDKPTEGETRRSLQFFDGHGTAVHKIHLRAASDVTAYERLVEDFASKDQTERLNLAAPETPALPEGSADIGELRERWARMTDVHQFVGILRALKLTRRQAVRLIGSDYAWPLDRAALPTMMERSAAAALPIMCFVGNRGCIQIHSGPIAALRPMGPWLNVMDPGFHLHLRTDHVRELWAVRKPNGNDGHVTSLEAYDAAGELIIQFFGKRAEGEGERADWRALVEALPRVAVVSAA